MPTPNTGESQKDFVSRCIPYVIKEGTAKDNSQAAAICHSIWKKHKGQKMSERVLLHLCANLSVRPVLVNEQADTDVTIERSTILVGDGTYNGIFFPVEEVRKATLGFNKQPIVLDHSDMVEDTVGYIDEPMFEGNKITVKPILDPDTFKYKVAKGFIDSRLRANAIPEVSVGIWCDKAFEDFDESERLVARNLQPDHLAIVTRGACSPQDGCGIGLQNDEITVTVVSDSDKYNYLIKEILKQKLKALELEA